MLVIVMLLFAAAWFLKSTFGKAIVLLLGVLMLAFLWGTGSFGGLLWGLCIATISVAAFGLARRFR